MGLEKDGNFTLKAVPVHQNVKRNGKRLGALQVRPRGMKNREKHYEKEKKNRGGGQ